MTKFEQSSKPHLLIAQTENNTTLWIGHLQYDPVDHLGGQTFCSPADGRLDHIQLFVSTVLCPGHVILSFHEFDPSDQTWKPAIAESELYLDRKDRQQWIQFNMPIVYLKKGSIYGFRLSTNKAMVGFGEAVRDTDHPFTFGNEWHASSRNEKGFYYSYFSMMFKVGMGHNT